MINWTAPPTTEDLKVWHRVFINNQIKFQRTYETIIGLKALTANTEYNVTVVAFNNAGKGGKIKGNGATLPEGLSNVIC